jgi:hypothetical protein
VQNALASFEIEAAETLAPASELLISGGDARLAVDGTGRNAYGCRPSPEAAAAFGSSTASTISPAGYAAAEHRRGVVIDHLQSASAAAVYAREAERLRGELTALLELDGLAGLQTVLSASGTDLHRLISRLVAGGSTRSLLSILGGASETGAGVPTALAVGDGKVAHVSARAPDGALRDPLEVDAEVVALAETAVADGRRVLLVMTDVSKTGLITPSLGCALSLKHRHPHHVDVLVDACQAASRPAR